MAIQPTPLLRIEMVQVDQDGTLILHCHEADRPAKGWVITGVALSVAEDQENPARVPPEIASPPARSPFKGIASTMVEEIRRAHRGGE